MKRSGGQQSGYDDAYDYQAPQGHPYDADAHQYWLDQQRYAAAVEEQQYDPRLYAPNPDEPYAYDEDGNPLYYAPAEAEQRRPRGMLMLGAVFAVAVLGAGGLFAYKALGGRGLGGEPPLIKADVEPVKTTPEPESDAGQRNKAVYDRVDDAKRQSKVVTREEQPVDLPAAPSAAPRVDGSRTILPGGDKSTVATGGDEPRRVKTMTIRPDGAVAAAPQSAPAAPVQTAESDPIAELARTGQAPASSEFNEGIMAEGEPARPAPRAAQAATPRPSSQAAATRPAPQPAPAAQAPARPSTQPAPAQQVASVAPRAPAPAATTPARATPGGAYVVQVTSQRSEQDARAAYSTLQKKFPSVLGSYQASIQPATVPDRGTYYRVRVGPFSSSTDASTLCSNLRSAGGDCVVSRN
ncbi:SPOR domain-containing protein [Hansschlegelia quercus]|uniref:SPOR domain-containing protein n=1 Tax=Hansschlegelia quercus TaxID=2528245 RepID=A0A4Q9GJC7_9HYPH|nr:SPOR domain-containing protein [Hansschlegelia quercus]TBN54198.1 SPOR domain-containing protein [Hansschlegelia quercus]